MLTALHAAGVDVEVAGMSLRGDDLRAAVMAFAEGVAGRERVAVVATPSLETVVAVAGALAAGCTVVPLNPAAGEHERSHVVSDSAAEVVIDAGDVDLAARSTIDPSDDSDRPAFVIYTSGTTGAPKGAVLSRRAVTACLDGLAEVWQWSERDVLAHALPLFHVHGLVLGTLGPLRFGGRMIRTERLCAVADANMYFAVPTMWARLEPGELARCASARMLVSGSAALPAPVFDRVRQATGQALVERYGLTESLIVTAAAVSDERQPGQVGRPLPGIDLRIANADDAGMGEVQLRGPTLFDGYLNRPDATAAAFTDDGWFRTGDIGRYDESNGLRLLGRLATDLIKTGGFKVGAGEIEDALLAYPGVAEAAVKGVSDDDLGERIVAWVVRDPDADRHSIDAETLVAHVAAMLAPHKRPREVRFVEELPRNAMGKLQKSQLT